MIDMENHLFRSLALTGFLGGIRKLHLFLSYLIEIFERLLNQEKIHIYFLESILPQALWVAGK